MSKMSFVAKLQLMFKGHEITDSQLASHYGFKADGSKKDPHTAKNDNDKINRKFIREKTDTEWDHLDKWTRFDLLRDIGIDIGMAKILYDKDIKTIWDMNYEIALKIAETLVKRDLIGKTRGRDRLVDLVISQGDRSEYERRQNARKKPKKKIANIGAIWDELDGDSRANILFEAGFESGTGTMVKMQYGELFDTLNKDDFERISWTMLKNYDISGLGFSYGAGGGRSCLKALPPNQLEEIWNTMSDAEKRNSILMTYGRKDDVDVSGSYWDAAISIEEAGLDVDEFERTIAINQSFVGMVKTKGNYLRGGGGHVWETADPAKRKEYLMEAAKKIGANVDSRLSLDFSAASYESEIMQVVNDIQIDGDTYVFGKALFDVVDSKVSDSDRAIMEGFQWEYENGYPY